MSHKIVLIIFYSLVGVVSLQASEDRMLPEIPTFKEGIRLTIQEKKRETRFCYEKLLQKKADAYGRMELEWDIDELGKVTTAKVVRNDLNDEDFAKCMIGVVQAMKFPAIKQDEIRRVVYPFVFTAN